MDPNWLLCFFVRGFGLSGFVSQVLLNFVAKAPDIGVQGWLLYNKGDYDRAEPLLRKAIEWGDTRFIVDYANLCESQGRVQEAARMLMMGALFGNGDAFSYVASISEQLIQDLTRDNLEQRAKQLLVFWQEARSDFEAKTS